MDRPMSIHSPCTELQRRPETWVTTVLKYLVSGAENCLSQQPPISVQSHLLRYVHDLTQNSIWKFHSLCLLADSTYICLVNRTIIDQYSEVSISLTFLPHLPHMKHMLSEQFGFVSNDGRCIAVIHFQLLYLYLYLYLYACRLATMHIYIYIYVQLSAGT